VVVALVLILLATQASPRASRERNLSARTREAATASSNVAPSAVQTVRHPIPVAEDPLSPDAVRDDLNRVPGADLVLRGVVLLHGAPVVDARVRLHRAYFQHSERGNWHHSIPWQIDTEPGRAPIAETRTDKEGRFFLATERRTRVVIEAKDAAGRVKRHLVHTSLLSDPDVQTIELEEGVRVRVRVVRPGGTPVANREVTISYSASAGSVAAMRTEPWSWGWSHARASRTPMARLTQRTDAAGRTEFLHVAAGRVLVRVGSIEAALVVPTGGEIAFVEETAATVLGTLSDLAGNPVEGVRLELTVATAFERLARIVATTRANGNFEFAHVPPGAFQAARVLGWGPIHVGAELVRLRETVEWHPRIRRPNSIEGVVETPEGKAVPAAVVTVVREGLELSRTVADESGWFALRSWGDEEVTVKAVAYGLVGSTVVRGHERCRVVAESSARVEGHIRGLADAATTQRRFHLVARDYERTFLVDSAGRFTLDHVPALQAASVKWIRKSKFGPFEVPAGQVVSLVIDAAPNRKVTGRVRDENGQPVAGAVVAAERTSRVFELAVIQPGWPGSTTTGPDGSFDVHGSGGTTHLLVSHPQYVPCRVPLHAQGKCAVVLRRGLEVGGTVVWDDGRPMRHALVTLTRGTTAASNELLMDRTTYTDARGRFLFSGVSAGHRVVRISERDYPPIREAKCEAGRTDHRIVFVSGGAIEGIVVNERGQPMAGYRQFVFSGDQVGTVRPGGRFRLTGLPAGRHDVHLADFARAGAVVVSERGVETGTRDLRLVVPPADD